MAFSNMIFAKQEKGWTPAAKILAVTYFDLSEKHGYAYARRKYLQFRTKASFDTISTANRIIEASGLFSIKYRANNSLRVTPNLHAIEVAYDKYKADHAEFKRLEAEWWSAEEARDEESDAGDTRRTFRVVDGNSDEVDGNFDEGSRKIRRGSSKNLSRNPSKDSFHQDSRSSPSSFHTHSDERVKTRPGSPRSRPSGLLAGDDDLRQFVAELHTILPEHVPFGDDDRKPFNAERSRQGELPQLRKLIRAGWTKDEVRDMVEVYVQSAREDAGGDYDPTFKTLSSIFAELLDKTMDQNSFEADEEFYGRSIPERFLHHLSETLAASAIDVRPSATESLDSDPPRDDDGRLVFTPDDIARHTSEPCWP